MEETYPKIKYINEKWAVDLDDLSKKVEYGLNEDARRLFAEDGYYFIYNNTHFLEIDCVRMLLDLYLTKGIIKDPFYCEFIIGFMEGVKIGENKVRARILKFEHRRSRNVKAFFIKLKRKFRRFL